MKTNNDNGLVIKDFRKLEVYKKSLEFVQKIYRVVEQFPKREEHILISQVLRASSSISLNIAEGTSQIYEMKRLNFLNISLGSANEVRAILDIAYRLKYISQEQFYELESQLVEIIKILIALMKKIKQVTA
ncbi:four helix bundle protein [Aneurinibacillus tyrosinisolvens]|uniref:four helix bundle protein n=1 Tax=Aneurinibacillus tyrosinisolvens TaxID=1443435 RepID=UPI00063F92E0|nr:four helix bundle protein [Aneurinibacillus tyrosinisolvens]